MPSASTPDIPSAKEFRGKSVAVGKMQERHLRKIEELTLYIIAQNHEIKRLSEKVKKIDELEKIIKTRIKHFK